MLKGEPSQRSTTSPIHRREREGERETETETETDRQTDRQTETERQTYRTEEKIIPYYTSIKI